MKLIKIKQKTNEKYYNFYLITDTGSKIRIMPNTYQDKSNYSVLALLAIEVTDNE